MRRRGISADHRGGKWRSCGSPGAIAGRSAEPGALPGSFWRLALGWAGSLTGDGLRVIALPLLAVSVDPSAAAVAAVAVASTLPWLLVAIPAGALVDRLDAAKVMAAAHLVRAVLTLGLVATIVTGSVIPAVGAVGFAITSAETFADGAAQSLLVRIVPEQNLDGRTRVRHRRDDGAGPGRPVAAGVLFVLAPWLPFVVSAPVSWPQPRSLSPSRSASPPASAPERSTNRNGARSPGADSGRAARLFTDQVLRVLVCTVAVMAIANPPPMRCWCSTEQDVGDDEGSIRRCWSAYSVARCSRLRWWAGSTPCCAAVR